MLHRNVIVIIIDSVCQKLNIHSQSEKAEILRDLCNRFLNLPLTAKSQESKVWNVKKLSIIVIRLCLLTCIYVRDFINVFNRRVTGFYRWAKLVDLNFPVTKKLSARWSNRKAK